MALLSAQQANVRDTFGVRKLNNREVADMYIAYQRFLLLDAERQRFDSRRLDGRLFAYERVEYHNIGKLFVYPADRDPSGAQASETHPLLWSYEWPRNILISVAIELNIPVGEWRSFRWDPGEPLYFPWNLAPRFVRAFSLADYAIYQWKRQRGILTSFFGAAHPDPGEFVTVDTKAKIREILIKQ